MLAITQIIYILLSDLTKVIDIDNKNRKKTVSLFA